MKAKLFLFAAIVLMAGCMKENTQSSSGITVTQGAIAPKGPNSTTHAITTTTADTSTVIDSINAVSWIDTVGFSYFYSSPVTYLSRPDSDIVMVYAATTNPWHSATIWTALPCANYLNTGDMLSFSYSFYKVKIIYNYPTAPTIPWVYFKIIVVPAPAVKRR